jgi:hypothetical protein
MRSFIITEQQLAATIEYLLSRPMVEVEQAVNALRRLPLYEEPAKPSEEEADK